MALTTLPIVDSLASAVLCLTSLTLQAAGKADAVRAAVLAADPSGEGYLTSEQLEQGLAAAGLKFTRHQVSLCHR
jgi:hypothetical protein